MKVPLHPLPKVSMDAAHLQGHTLLYDMYEGAFTFTFIMKLC
jgi:hypothetical protein